MATGAMAIAGFSVALAEVFAGVGLSTIIPATWVEIARAARRLLDGSGGPGSISPDEMNQAINSIAKLLPSATAPNGSTDNTQIATKILQSLLASSDTIDLLLPKSAHIDASFNFQAAMGVAIDVGVGGAISMVTLKAGYSALYSESSSCKVNMNIDYVSVQEQLASARFSGTPVSGPGHPVPITFKKGDPDITRSVGPFSDAQSGDPRVVTVDVTKKGDGIVSVHAVDHGDTKLSITFTDGSGIIIPVHVDPAPPSS